ncbi:MAG TPA: penicillin acylase family protein, partial [Blastocatellia bacterium]|nr:penicillin acylase family protein [Blastocatellia bacterium]
MLNARLLWVAMIAVIALSPGSPAGGAQTKKSGLEKIAQSVTIYRDTWGVPHVYGPSDYSVMFGFIYAQCEDNWWQIEDSYIQALGRASEVYGDRMLVADLINRAFEISRLSQAEYEKLSPQSKELCRAVSDGYNYFLEKNPQVKPRLLTKFEPWYPIAFGRFAQYQLFIYRRLGIKEAETLAAIPEVQANGKAGGSGRLNGLNGRDFERLSNSSDPWEASAIGSNMWAIMPKKSASGRAMLFINPHQPFFGPGQWIEGHVHSDSGWNMTGATFPGSPFPSIGHNDYLGWSHTVNVPDVIDAWTEQFDDPKNPLKYRYGSGFRTATQWSDSVRIQTPGGLVTKTFKFRKTHHGPVVAVRDGRPLSVRMAMYEEGGQMEQRYLMSKARNFKEFKAAMSRLAIPMFNTMYADREGNIWYCYYGAVPKRDPKYDWSQPVDGSIPGTEWRGYHALDELPQVFNPSTGWTQNCNATPFLATAEGAADNPDPAKYPAYMVPEPDNSRSRISRRILSERPQFTFEDWERAAFDNRCIEAETLIPALAAEWERLKAADPAKAAATAEAIETLKAWNGRAEIDSVAMSVFALWAFTRTQPQTRAATRDLPFPDLAILELTLGNLAKSWGTWKVKWGELARLQRVHTSGLLERFDDNKYSVPVPGGPGEYVGIVFNFYTPTETPIAKGLKRLYGQIGHSFVSVVEFG